MKSAWDRETVSSIISHYGTRNNAPADASPLRKLILYSYGQI